jgi:hypothetical protein
MISITPNPASDAAINIARIIFFILFIVIPIGYIILKIATKNIKSNGYE